MPFNEPRASDRINCEAPVTIQNCQTGEYYDGSIYNYSRGGMYVEMDFPLAPESEIRVVIEKNADLNRPANCQAKVIWCKQIPGAIVLYSYGIGVQYDPTIQLANCIKNFRIIEGGATKRTL